MQTVTMELLKNAKNIPDLKTSGALKVSTYTQISINVV
jgi:hypothetical protein